MSGGFLHSSFGATLALITWVALPLYAAALGLALAHSRPHSTDESARPEVGRGPSTVLAQVSLIAAAAALTALYRGYEGPMAQGQLALGAAPSRLHALVTGMGALGLGLLVPTMGYQALTNPVLGLRVGSLAPLTLVLWSLLPLVTHLTTALLVLELVGVSLIWAITSAPARARQAGVGAGPLGTSNGVILFVWASGLSALALLLALGVDGLSTGLGGALPLAPGAGPSPLSGALLSLVISLKFLVGGGQFLLMAWYRYLPPEALAFYLTFYYPAHLTVGLAVLAGLALAHLQAALAVITGGLGLGLLFLVPHLGVQSSPALTLAGSSFVGLAFVTLGMLS